MDTKTRFLIAVIFTLFPAVLFRLMGGDLAEMSWFSVIVYMFNAFVQGLTFQIWLDMRWIKKLRKDFKEIRNEAEEIKKRFDKNG